MATTSSNFSFLSTFNAGYESVALQAEQLLHNDPVACLVKLRALAEFLAQRLDEVCGLRLYTTEQFARIQALYAAGVLDEAHAKRFHLLRTAGNTAVHEHRGDLATAKAALRALWEVAVFTRRTHDPGFKPQAFVYPPPHKAETEALYAELAAAQKSVEAAQATQGKLLADIQGKENSLSSLEGKLAALVAQLQAVGEDCTHWENLAKEAEQKHLDALDALRQNLAATPGAQEVYKANAARASAAYVPTEAEVRAQVDRDLTRAGWIADSTTRRWALGARPDKGVQQAIAEVPTSDGVADYVLFDGFDALAVVEAKAAQVDVPGALEQAKRYALATLPSPAVLAAGGPWAGGVRVPFVFATNGRAFFPQLKERSGIWFAPLHRPAEPPRPLAGWYTPEGLRRALALDPVRAHQRLAAEPTAYLGLRPYQLRAIAAAEDALSRNARRILLAMATGTGKTRTCLGFLYRTLKAQRFRRILFLVDRTPLADQAMEQFATTHLEGARSLHEIYDVKSLDDGDIEPDTRVHVATVQGLIHRLFGGDDPSHVPPVDQYDCIVVDECHRGYTLDAEMSDTEMQYRSAEAYLSTFRRAIEHFDAVCIGLTATPALHTTQIFGRPVYQYRFRDAVLDGWLVDQEPIVRIRTQRAAEGIYLPAGTEVQRWDPARNTAALDVLPDAVQYNLDDFNARVIVESFNRVVCEELVRQIDPDTPGKTLVFCVNDAHADTVVRCLREALASIRGITDPDVVAKITGKAHRPKQMLKRFRLERLPDIAVTVDLLTTGVDVPAINCLVFLRAVQSRILYEQMLGRATRLCGEIQKSSFKVFDAVGVTEALHAVSTMAPVAADPSFTFGQLAAELDRAVDDTVRDDILDQLVARLRARIARLSPQGAERFASHAGDEPAAVLDALRALAPDEHALWWSDHPALLRWLDEATGRPQGPIVFEGDDEVIAVVQDVGMGLPEEYLDAFGAFITQNVNLIPALQVVVQRPRDLTRATLKELRSLLADQGYREPSLQAAWKQTRNADIAAGIVGHIRQKALGSPLLAYELRIDAALAHLLASRVWTEEQARWLQRIALQMRHEVVVDRESLEFGAFAAHGGARTLDRVFGGEVEAVLGDLLDAAWNDNNPELPRAEVGS